MTSPTAPGGLLGRVLSTIERYAMLLPRDRALVAVSGGPDSVALLSALLDLRGTLPLDLTVAHLDHGLRGEEAEADRRFVEDLARRLELPCVWAAENVAALARREKLSLEAAARAARRRFLKREAERLGARRIALGHHRDDQAETVLLRLVEGSGRSGLSGIKPVSEHLYVRPLIDCSRSEIRAYLEERKLPYRWDRSNDDPRFPRNRVRRGVLPLLERELNPRAAEAIARTAETLREEDEYLERIARGALRRLRLDSGETNASAQPVPAPHSGVSDRSGEATTYAGHVLGLAGDPAADGVDACGPVALDAEALVQLPLPIGRRVVRLALRRAGLEGRDLDKARIEEILALAARRGSNADLAPGGGLAVRLEYGRLLLCAPAEGEGAATGAGGAARAAAGSPHSLTRAGFSARSAMESPGGALTIELPIPGCVELAARGLSLCARVATRDAAEAGLRTAGRMRAYLDADLLVPPLLIRAPRPGDRFRPLGAPGSRKLSDQWTDLKLAEETRRRLVVVESAGRICWVPGLAIEHEFRITDSTRRVAALEAILPAVHSDRSAIEPPHAPLPTCTEPSAPNAGNSARSGAAARIRPKGSASSATTRPLRASPLGVSGPPMRSDSVLYTAAQISAAVARLAREVDAWAAGREILALGVLHGSFIFAADLVRRLTVPVRIGFVDREGTPISPSLPLAGARVLLVEDILDTGESLDRILARSREWKAAEVKTCVLFDKLLEQRKVPMTADFTGLTVPDRWVVGYGLDNSGLDRNLPYLTWVEPGD